MVSVIGTALPAGVAVSTLLIAAYLIALTFLEDPARAGQDFRFYRDVGDRWLSSGVYYLPRQLEGEYELALMVDVLYPPPALLLFVPLALLPPGLDGVAWWGVPLAIVALQVWRERPAPWTFMVAGLLLLWPRSYGSFVWGNTDIWLLAAVAGGVLWGWPALLAALKPSFAFLALVGIRDRSWWIGGVILAAISLLALPLWFDYARAMTSIRGLGLDYSLFNLPIALIPLVFHLGRTRSPSRTEGTGPPSARLVRGLPRLRAPGWREG